MQKAQMIMYRKENYIELIDELKEQLRTLRSMPNIIFATIRES